jgi:hypothetical protein
VIYGRARYLPIPLLTCRDAVHWCAEVSSRQLRVRRALQCANEPQAGTVGASSWDASAGSSDVNESQINVDHFYHRPTYRVVGLLTEHSEIPAISRELESAGVDVAAAEILCGEQGARILDAHGRYHGLRARIVRAFQQLGYDETTLAIYDEALRDGDLLLHVPARPEDSGRIAALLQRHHVHDVGYFGPGTFEQFPISDTG